MNQKQALFKNIEASVTFKNICQIYDLPHKTVLDIGCGFGQYLQGFGKGSVGITTAPDEVEFGQANGLKIIFGNAEHLQPVINSRFQAIWANNLFEHLLSPHAFLMNLKKFAENDAVAIIGVPVVPKIVSLVHLKWFRGTLASNHVNFFTHTTLQLTAERAGWNILAVRPFIFKNYFLDALVRPFAPHIYVVAKNNPDFKYPEKKVHEWKDDAYYADLLKITHQDA